MIKIKDNFIEKMYFICCLIFTFATVWEIPYAVFFAPVLLCIVFTLYKVALGVKLHFDRTSICFLIFCIAYCISIIDPSRKIGYQIYVHLQAICMFWIGCNAFTDKDPVEKRKLLEKYFLIISIMYVLYVSVTLYNYYFNMVTDLEDRFYYSFWYGSLVVKPATVIAMSLVFPMTFGLYSIFFLKLPYKIVGVLFDAYALAFSFFSGSRTMIFVFPMLLVAMCVAYFLFVKKNKVAALVIVASIIGLCGAVLLIAKIFKRQFYTAFHEYGFYRLFYEGFGSSLRTKYALNVLKDFSIFYTGGGKHSAEVGTPHNIWLYLYDHGGFIPFFIYMIFTFLLATDGVNMLFSKKVEMQMKFLVFTIFSIIFLEYFLEPFILPIPSFYVLGLFLMGVITSEARREPKKISFKLVSSNT